MLVGGHTICRPIGCRMGLLLLLCGSWQILITILRTMMVLVWVLLCCASQVCIHVLTTICAFAA
jgi:hypothetical protein